MAHKGTSGTPHNVVGGILDSVTQAAAGVGSSVNRGLQDVGEGIQSGLDAPFKSIDGPEQPLRIVDRLLDGGLGAVDQLIVRGAVGSLNMAGEAVCHALDQPVENFGIPPALGQGMGGLKLPRTPRLLGPRSMW